MGKVLRLLLEYTKCTRKTVVSCGPAVQNNIKTFCDTVALFFELKVWRL